MRRSYLFAGLILATVITAGVVWRGRAREVPAKAQTPPVEAPEAAQARALPLTQVVLFSSGVAYFQREGVVDGDVRVDLTFPVGNVNDLLKSLVFHDLGGGKVRAVSYDGQEPVDRTLKAFALDLTYNPTLGQLLNQARGEKVEVSLQNAANQPATLTGVIMGMEAQAADAKDKGHEVEMLNLVCAEGVRAVPLSQVSRFRFLNPTLDNEFRKALDVLATAHNSQKRTVSLHLTGEGKRTVKIGYVLENPIWKTSYRLMLDKGNKATLQGFALVENTTEEDWKDVRLVLVAGRPISFQMDMYQPLFLPRPTVEPERFASLRPPVYQGDLAAGGIGQLQIGQLQIGQLQIGQIGQLQIGQLGNLGVAGGLGMGPSGHFSPPSGGRYQTPIGSQGQAEPRVRLSYEELQRRRQEQQAKQAEATKIGEAVAAADPGALDAAFQAEGSAEHYKYVVEDKLTLARQKSAMLPIVTHAVDAERVSIYNPFVNIRFPLLGVRFRNTTGQHLAQGPVTVFEDGDYAGDARLPDLSPGEHRPLGYAVDLAREVKIVDDWTVGPKITLDPRNEQVTIGFDKRHLRKYVIRNRLKDDRRLLLDHPIRSGLHLHEDNKPIETTHSRYRFLLEAAGDKTTTFAVAEVEHCSSTVNFQQRNGEGGEDIRSAATGLNIDLEAIRREPEATLAGVKIVEGVVVKTTNHRREVVYRLSHATGQKLEVTLDHDTVKGRTIEHGKRVLPDGTVYRFEFEVPGRKGQQTVVERWTESRWVASTEKELGAFQASSVVSAKVKAALREVGERRAALAALAEEVAELSQKRTAITDEQARLRANIANVPHDSAAYKRYLAKFDAQETELEKLHEAIEGKKATIKKSQREFDVYLKALNVE
jgi:hypothetical protein